MKIAVMGAGGIGGYVGGRLAAAGEEVHLIARGVHLAALRRDGLRIESPLGDLHLPAIHATDDPAAVGVADLVLFTVKLKDTDAAAAALAPMIGPGTRVVTLQNGIDSRAMIARHVPPGQVAAGVFYIGAHIKAPGVIHNAGGVHRIVVDARDGDETIVAFAAAGSRAVGLEVVPADDGERAVWRKFIMLVALSGVTSLMRRPIGAVLAHPDARDFFRQLIAEAIAVADAEGHVFAPDVVDEIVGLVGKQPYEQKSSMLVDLESGKPLELPWLSGRVHALGRTHGIPTPANTAVWVSLCTHVDGAPGADGG